MRLSPASLTLALLACLTPACGDPEGTPSPVPDAGVPDMGVPDTGAPDAGDGGPPPVCGTANKALPAGAVELAWDDGIAAASVRDQDWSIEVNGKTYALNDNVLHEAVRFEIDRPARVVGYAIQWAALPEGIAPETELSAGLYPDFGYNGFDFWAPEPYFTGTRCAGDVEPGKWLTYVLDEPVEITHPGLVYVAHRIETSAAPVFAFDESVIGAGDCAGWDDCHSAMNLPNAQKASFYNGISFPFQYDYLVRLYVEYTDDLAPKDRFFQPTALAAGAHVSWGDYDGDGFDDAITDGPTLHHNEGDGTFTDATASSGVAALGITATGGVWGDYDNDGCLDLFLYAESYTAADTLLRSSCDGTFTDVTASAGIVDQQSYNNCGDPLNTRSPSAAAAFLDIDADGLLDLYLANFICWSNYSYYTDTVFRNKGDNTFEEWTAKQGFSSKKTASRGAAPADCDGDADVDLFVNNYVLQANLLFVNNGDGTVTEKAVAAGAAGTKTGTYFGHTIGAAWGDLDNDGDLDLVAANLAHPRFFDFSDKTQVLMNDGKCAFTDITGGFEKPVSAAGLRYQETHSVPVLADVDLDGVLDLVITAIYPGRPTDFYWGKGDGTFTLDAYHAGITTENGWGAAASDFDNDGDTDLYASTLFENTLPVAKKGHFFQVRAIGNVSANRAAIGASVWIEVGGKKLLRHVQGGTGKGGQDSMYLSFGLGAATSVDAISVVFPGGKTVKYPGPFAADQRLWVYEDGATFAGWAPPSMP